MKFHIHNVTLCKNNSVYYLFLLLGVFLFFFSIYHCMFHSHSKVYLLLQMHIQTLRGRILETVLSLRFLIFQYGIVYKLHLTGRNTSLAVYFCLFTCFIACINMMIFILILSQHVRLLSYKIMLP